MGATDREYLHALIERMPAHLVPTATGVIEGLVKQEGDPVLRALAEAPVDDEPVTEADRRALDEAWEEVRRGETIPHEEIKREFGIS